LKRSRNYTVNGKKVNLIWGYFEWPGGLIVSIKWPERYYKQCIHLTLQSHPWLSRFEI